MIPLISVTLVQTVSGRPIADAVTCFRFYMPERMGGKKERQKMRCVIMILTGGRGGAGVLLFCLAGDSLRMSVSITSLPPPPRSPCVIFSSIYSMLLEFLPSMGGGHGGAVC